MSRHLPTLPPLTALSLSLLLAACGGPTTPAQGEPTGARLEPLTTPTSGRTYAILSTCATSDKGLDVTNASQDNGGAVALWDYYSGSNQQWTLQATDGGYFKLLAKHSGKALDVSNAATADRSPVAQWDYWGATNQQWKFDDLGNGTYEISPRHAPGMRLDVRGGATTNGTALQINSDSNSCAQRWLLRAVSAADSLTTVRVNATGASVSGDYVALPSNGAAASLVVPGNAPGTVNLKVRASGDLYGSEFPTLELRRGAAVLKSFQINSETGQLYDLGGIGVTPGETLSLAFVNDAYGGAGNDRNAYVDYGDFSWGTGTSPTPTDPYVAPDPTAAFSVASEPLATGEVDDTNRIRRAVLKAKAANKNLYFPAGTYRLSRPVYFDDWSGKTVFGASGAKVLIANWSNEGGENGAFTFRRPANVMIRDLAVEGSVDLGLSTHGVNHMSAVSVFNPRGFTAYKLTVSKVQSNGVYCQDGGTFTVQDSRFNFVHGSSVAGRTCNDVTVRNNLAEGTANPAEAPNRPKGPVGDEDRHAPNRTGGIGIFFQMGDRILIENNLIRNQWDTATKTEGSDDVTYRGNTVDTFGKDGIKIMFIPEGQAALREVPVIQVANGVIENNTVRNFKKWKWDGSGGYALQGVRGGRLTNNTFYGPGLAYENQGLTINSNGPGVPQPQDVIAEDNILYDAQVGINNETVTASVLRRNKFLSSNGAVNTQSCIWVGRGDGTTVEDNLCQKYTADGIMTYGGASLTFQRNRFSDGDTGVAIWNPNRATIRVLSNSFSNVSTPLLPNGSVAQCSGNTSNGAPVACP